jgi:hypothetical protein
MLTTDKRDFCTLTQNIFLCANYVFLLNPKYKSLQQLLLQAFMY